MSTVRPPQPASLTGLDPAEAARRLAAEGPNLLPGSTPKPIQVHGAAAPYTAPARKKSMEGTANTRKNASLRSSTWSWSRLW